MKISTTRVFYQTEIGSVSLDLNGDPFDICNAVAKRMGFDIQKNDLRFLEIMAARKKDGFA